MGGFLSLCMEFAMKKVSIFSAVAAAVIALSAAAAVPQQNDSWYTDGQSAIEKAMANKPITGKAKNVILFVGDGMSVVPSLLPVFMPARSKVRAVRKTA